MYPRQKKIIVLLLSIALYIISLTQTAFSTPEPKDSVMMPFVGWLGILAGSAACISWVANPLLLVSWLILFKNIKTAFIFSLLSSLFSISFLLFNKIIVDEAGNYTKIETYDVGYWLWLSSNLILLVGSFDLYLKDKKQLMTINNGERQIKSLFKK